MKITFVKIFNQYVSELFLPKSFILHKIWIPNSHLWRKKLYLGKDNSSESGLVFYRFIKGTVILCQKIHLLNFWFLFLFSRKLDLNNFTDWANAGKMLLFLKKPRKWDIYGAVFCPSLLLYSSTVIYLRPCLHPPLVFSVFGPHTCSLKI